MNKLLVICAILGVFLINYSESAPRYQYLEKREGYVPVYIRLGNTPLAEINPSLAEAFNEHTINTRGITSGEVEMMMNDQTQNKSSSESNESNSSSQERTSAKAPIPAEPAIEIGTAPLVV